MVRSKIYGSEVREFEAMLASYFDNALVISVCNASIGILGTLYALGLQHKEVITTPLTWAGALTPFIMLKNTIIFGEIEAPTLTLNPDTIEQYITPNTKAIFSSDFLGYPCRLDKIKTICKRHNLFLIHDAASSICTSYKNKYSGSYADVCIYSFGRNKPFSIGEGGAIITRNKNIYQRLIEKITHPERQDIELETYYPLSLNTNLNPLAIRYGLDTFHTQLRQINNHKQYVIKELSTLDNNINTCPNYYKPIIQKEKNKNYSLKDLPFPPLTNNVDMEIIKSYKIIEELCLIK